MLNSVMVNVRQNCVLAKERDRETQRILRSTLCFVTVEQLLIDQYSSTSSIQQVLLKLDNNIVERTTLHQLDQFLATFIRDTNPAIASLCFISFNLFHLSMNFTPFHFIFSNLFVSYNFLPFSFISYHLLPSHPISPYCI